MTTCEYCKSENVGHAIGMYFIAYECHDCGHQWIERFEGIEDSRNEGCDERKLR